MRFLICLIVYLMTTQVSLAGDTLEMDSKDALQSSARLIDEGKYDQALSISLAIYEQRKKDYVVAGILAMKAYFQTRNIKRVVLIGDEIKDVVKRDLVFGNDSLGDWNVEMVDYFYWTFTQAYAGALYLEKRNSDAIPYFRKLISHVTQAGGDAFIHINSLATSCLSVRDFQCAEDSYLQLLSAAKKNVEYGKYETGIYYNLACAATGLGDYKKAKDYLLSTGWEWAKLEKLIAGDNDLKGFRESKYFEQLRSRIKKT